jgi:octaprenyl-diphosphate synthase
LDFLFLQGFLPAYGAEFHSMSFSALNSASGLVAKELLLFEERYGNQFEYHGAFLQSVLAFVGSQTGKRIRPVVYFLTQGVLSPYSKKDIDIAVLIELMHTASLLHDDVVDGTDHRRGGQSLKSLMGNQLSVLSGDYLMAKALTLAVSMPFQAALPVLSRTLLVMTEAELKQAEMKRTEAVSRAEYLEIAAGKTASLFEAGCELAARVQKADWNHVELFRRFGLYFGMAFQIWDDIQDITGNAEAIGKPVGQDLGNGKWTLPLILAVEQASTSERARFFKRIRRFSSEDRQWIVEFIHRHEGVEKAEAKAEAEAHKAVGLLSSFPDSEYKNALKEICMIGMEKV